ncbi:hypothetical protein J2Y46_003756 [Microbacterium sp. BE35]|uniref:hypothetical protein n=1 Tax=Microbacterium sp. BE35 TaxID=2817773 RepID=UPI002854E04B|nr:hypothetical protein [Microbacterium sp. BE35]MDR7190898.1 hypothetical protein [Microbacterium sp. BE35]
MARSLGSLAVLSLIVLLAGCTPAAGDTAAPSPSPEGPTASSTPTPTSPGLDGEWIVDLADPDPGCIMLLGYRHLTVAGETGTLDTGETPLAGPVELHGDAVTMHLERTAPTKDAIDITAALGQDGVARGTGEAGGIHPGGTNGYACTIPLSLVPAGAVADMPPFDTIDGTWCAAYDRTSCMTIADSMVADLDNPPHSKLDDPTPGGFGDPCYGSGMTPIDPNGGGGAALYFCPKGYAIQTGSGGVEGEIIAEHDNVAFDRLYLTQNPPYLGVYFREDDLAAALQQ